MLYKLIEDETKEYTKEELIALVKKATQDQLYYMKSGFDYIGFYQEDRRKSIRQYIISCLENCYENEPTSHYTWVENNKMRDAVLLALNK